MRGSPEACLSRKRRVELPQSIEGLKVPGEPKASPIMAAQLPSQEA